MENSNRCQTSDPASTSAPNRKSERFLILCRCPSEATTSLAENLASYGTVEIISDTGSADAVWYPDDAMEGFSRLGGFCSSHRPVIAWERAWKHLDLTSGAWPANVWLIEDDVAGNAGAWARVVEETLAVDADLSAIHIRSRDADPGWHHWRHGDGIFNNPGASFNPLCRLSTRLVAMVLDFRRCHGRFIFQEVLFASLIAEHGFSFLDWQKNVVTKPHFRSFSYCSEVRADASGICHPVKDARLHRAICENPHQVDIPIKSNHDMIVADSESYLTEKMTARRSGAEFPKITHQIWLGKSPLPAQSQLWRESLFTHLPDWEHRLWTDADLAELEPGMLCPELVVDEDMGMGIRADVMRYEILRQHGGLYLDHDIELLGPLDEIMVEDCIHFGYELRNQSMIGNAIIGSPRGHPFWKSLLDRIRATAPRTRPENCWDVIHLTGPVALREAIHAWAGRNMTGYAIQLPDGHTVGWLYDQADMVGWNDETVYPYYYTERETIGFRAEDYPRAYAAHHWGQTWMRE